MICLDIDLVYSRVAAKPGTGNWRLHLASDFLNCLLHTCPKLALSRTLQRQVAVSTRKGKSSLRPRMWAGGQTQALGKYENRSGRSEARPLTWEGRSRLKTPLAWYTVWPFAETLRGSCAREVGGRVSSCFPLSSKRSLPFKYEIPA